MTLQMSHAEGESCSELPLMESLVSEMRIHDPLQLFGAEEDSPTDAVMAEEDEGTDRDGVAEPEEEEGEEEEKEGEDDEEDEEDQEAYEADDPNDFDEDAFE